MTDPDKYFLGPGFRPGIRSHVLVDVCTGSTISDVLGTSGVTADQVLGIGIEFTACTMLQLDAGVRPPCKPRIKTERLPARVKLWKNLATDRVNLWRSIAAKRSWCVTEAGSRRSGSSRRFDGG